jgi:hypothetical protein
MRTLTIAFILCLCTLRAQDTISKWTLLNEYSLETDAIWTTDILENIYVVHNRTITKFDSTGVKKFSQSIKSIGQVKEIIPINTMKLVLFSEEQQVLCLLDNTLTMSENLIDLSEYGIVNASLATTSSQPEKIWILDQLNSRLLLLDLSGKMQFQEVRNLKGMLNLTEISSMVESNNHLFLIGSGKFYEFDIYGTLLNELEFGNSSTGALECVPAGERFYWILRDELIGQDLDGGNEQGVKLPVKQIVELKKAGDIYYFRTADKILKYALKKTR